MSVLSNQDIERIINKDIVIHPYGEDCISPIGYDLRIGCALNLTNQDSNSDKKIILTSSDAIEIPAKTSMLVITKEYVYLSKKIAGTLHARGSLAAKGIFMNSTTVDPNWNGQLTFLIYNNNDKPIELDIESRFVTLIFHQVNTPTLSTPRTNPISVAKKYGDIYGQAFNTSIVEYLSSPENYSLEKDFDELVQEAKKPGLYETAYEAMKKLLELIKEFVSQKLSKIVAKILLIIPIILIFGGLTIELYWDQITSFLNLDVPYGLTVIVPQITMIGIGLTSLTALMNFIKGSK